MSARLAPVLALLPLLLIARPGSAQLITPNTSFEPVPTGAISITAEATRFDETSFKRGSETIGIPGTLLFDTEILRITWAPLRRFVVGAALPYRFVTYRTDFGGTLRRQGSPGIAVFAGFLHHLFRRDAVVQLAFQDAPKSNDPVLSASDGIPRTSLVYALTRPRDDSRLVDEEHFEFTTGPHRGADRHRYGTTTLHLAAGMRATARLDVLAIAEFGASTVSKEDGTYYDDRPGFRIDAGAMLQWRAGALRLRLSAIQTVRLKDGPAGRRFALSIGRAWRLRH